MHATLPEVWKDILHGQTADEPAKDKKGILGLLSKPENPLVGHFARLQGTLQSYQYGNYYVTSIMGWLRDWIGKPAWIFQFSGSEFQKLIDASPLNTPTESYYAEWSKELAGRGWLEGNKRLLFRFFPLLLAYRTGQIFNYLDGVIQKIPEDHRREVFLLMITGLLKKGRLTSAISFSIQMLRRLDLSAEERDWLFQHIETESEASFGGRLHHNMELLRAIAEELRILSETHPWPVYTAYPFEEFQVYRQLEALESEACMDLLILSPTIVSLLDNRKDKFDALLNHFIHQIVWTESNVMRFLQYQAQSNDKVPLPKGLLTFLEMTAAQGNLSTAVYEAIWDFYHVEKSYQRTIPGLEQLLRKETMARLQASPWELTLEALLMSGFHPISIPTNHSPYHGMHPDQIRPLFQLIREVADIDIIKIYRVEKMYRVRFLLCGEQYDIHTGHGFGVGCLPDLNTLLFEKGIPYQLVVMNMTYFSPASQNPYNPLTVVTLVNGATFSQYKDNILAQHLAGFAKSPNEVPVFLKNTNELGQMKDRPDEDTIDLNTDPKFAAIREQLVKLQPLEAWTKLLHHALRFPFEGKPPAVWQKEARTLADKLSPEQFCSGLALLIDNLIKSEEWFSDDEKVCGLRGLTWFCRLHPDNGQLFLLQKVANRAYTKITGGPLNAKTGNLALEGLSSIGSVQAFGTLSNLKAKAKYPVYLRAIASAMKKFTALLKLYPESELQDRVIPDHELIDGQKKIPIGDYEAVIRLEGMKVKLSWLNDKGKAIASVPAELRRDYPGELQAVKAAAKNIEETLQAQTQRLENSWLEARSWSFSLWQECFLFHELMGRVVKKLIWQFEDEAGPISFMPEEDNFVDSQGKAIVIPSDAVIRLWHPALAGSVKAVVDWRNRLFDRQIVQPFKQAFREVYLLTPAEEVTFDHSNRFAGHRLQGNTLYSLGKTRSWIMSYDQAPLRKLPEAGIVAELGILGQVLYGECTTQSLCFKEWKADTKQSHLYGLPNMALTSVPPAIFSEIMRDVDLFVAVSNIGIDPYFDQKHTGDLLSYWKEVSFGEKSKTSISDIRKDLLERLLPMTKIAKQCKLEGNYLHVAGKRRSYKINLGSGNILMLPNDQYLCIVQNSDPKVEKQIWLPFEGGDHTLMLILSKAFLLADDDKITDSQILRQIGSR